MIKDEERAELDRIIAGGAYNDSFWRSRWYEARQPSEEDLIRQALRECATETVQGRRTARNLQRKLDKLAGRKRALSASGYAQGWSEEQKRLDNLQHAAIYLSRAATGFHFYA